MRRNTIDRLVFAVVLFSLLLPGGLALGQEHRLSLEAHRPVGATYTVRVKGDRTITQTQSVDGAQARSSSMKVVGSMTGEAEVLALHDNDQVRQVAVRVQKFEGERDGQAVMIDVTKRIIMTAKNGETIYKYEGGDAVSKEAAEVLDIFSEFLVKEKPDRATYDQMFKLNQPRKAGTSWACDNALMAKNMIEGGELVIDEDDIESKFQFLAVGEFNDKPAAVFEVTMQLDGFTIPDAKENGLTLKSSKGDVKMSGLLPLDPKSGDNALQVQVQMGFVAEVKQGGSTVQLGFAITGQADADFRRVK